MTNSINSTETTETLATVTETTETAAPVKAPKAKKAPVNYPFESKAVILAKVAADDQFMLRSLCLLHDFQTEHEQNTKSTLNRNHRGFMSSHAVNGSRLAEKVKSGEGLTAEETEKARSIVSRYGKQLAGHARQVAVEQNPELASIAAIFGV